MSIKINRAYQASTIGAHRSSAAAMLQAIPDEVISALPARLVGQLMDANWRLAMASKAIAQADALAEGCIWDRHGNAREVA